MILAITHAHHPADVYDAKVLKCFVFTNYLFDNKIKEPDDIVV